MPSLPVVDYFIGDDDVIIRVGGKRLDVTWSQLMWGAITVGRRNHFDVYRFGFASRMECVWRSAMVFSSLSTCRVGPTSYFGRSDSFNHLDGSEKGAITYFLGLASAKVAAEVEYNVPWLMHLDVYSRGRVPRGIYVPILTLPGNTRPDLVGQSAVGQRLVMEAKGRTGRIDAELRLTAKEQTRRILTINHNPPTWRVGSLISLGGVGMELELVDPSNPTPDAVAIEIPEYLFLAEYYLPFVAMLRDGDSREIQGPDGISYQFILISDEKLGVGLMSPLYQLLDRELPRAQLDSVNDVNPDLRGQIMMLLAERTPFKSEAFYVGSDGVMLKLGSGWQELVRR